MRRKGIRIGPYLDRVQTGDLLLDHDAGLRGSGGDDGGDGGGGGGDVPEHRGKRADVLNHTGPADRAE
jgi:hypothetical protein